MRQPMQLTLLIRRNRVESPMGVAAAKITTPKVPVIR
jgi:hypothetical protein